MNRIIVLISMAIVVVLGFVGCGDNVPTAPDQNQQITNPTTDQPALDIPDVWMLGDSGDSTGAIEMIDPPTQPPPPPADSSRVQPTTIGKVKQRYIQN